MSKERFETVRELRDHWTTDRITQEDKKIVDWKRITSINECNCREIQINVVILILFKILEENTNEKSCLEIKRKKVLYFYRQNMLR